MLHSRRNQNGTDTLARWVICLDSRISAVNWFPIRVNAKFVRQRAPGFTYPLSTPSIQQTTSKPGHQPHYERSRTWKNEALERLCCQVRVDDGSWADMLSKTSQFRQMEAFVSLGVKCCIFLSHSLTSSYFIQAILIRVSGTLICFSILYSMRK